MLLATAPVMFFGGKGGVGKTTVSAACAARLAEAGHEWTPRVSVSRSVFPIVDDTSRRLFTLICALVAE